MADQVERWAMYVRDNPKKWKKSHTLFINSQFQKHKEFVKRLLKTKNGKEKLVKIYKIKNLKAFEGILRN